MTEKRTKSLLTIEDAEALLILDEMLPLILDDEIIYFAYGVEEFKRDEFYNDVWKGYNGNRLFEYSALQVIKRLKETITYKNNLIDSLSDALDTNTTETSIDIINKLKNGNL